MTRINLDAEMRTRLMNLTEPLDLCDETGRVLGTYTPLARPDAQDDDVPQPSDEELRRRAQGPGYTTDEVIAHLESL